MEGRPMDDQQMKAQIEAMFGAGDMEALARAQDAMSAEDVVVDWPQSGERIHGRANVAAINEHFPRDPAGRAPKGTLRRVLAPGEAWIVEGTIDYGDGVPVSMISIMEMKDGKIVHQTDYFASPFEAPAWRRQWVERDEPVAAR
jgi:hypothetical protein